MYSRSVGSVGKSWWPADLRRRDDAGVPEGVNRIVFVDPLSFEEGEG